MVGESRRALAFKMCQCLFEVFPFFRTVLFSSTDLSPAKGLEVTEVRVSVITERVIP